MQDFPDLPDFLNRKLNGIEPESASGKRYVPKAGIVWPRKKNWRKIEQRRRERERREGISLAGTTITNRKGQ